MSDKDLMLKVLAAPEAVKRKVADLLDGKIETSRTDAAKAAPPSDTLANGKALLTITETARLLGVSRPTAYVLAKRGQLDAAVVSGVRRITAKSINKYLAQFEGKGWGK